MYFLVHFWLEKRASIPLQGLWYFDELVTVNSNAALDVKVVIKQCIMSMIRRALNMIPQLTVCWVNLKATRCMGVFIHALMENTVMFIFTL